MRELWRYPHSEFERGWQISFFTAFPSAFVLGYQLETYASESTLLVHLGPVSITFWRSTRRRVSA